MQLLFILIISFVVSVALGSACIDGVCQMCVLDDTDKACIDTGKKMMVTCDSKEIWASCVATPGEEQTAVILFQIVMAALGALAYWGVQTKKAKTLSLFEARKRAAKGKNRLVS